MAGFFDVVTGSEEGLPMTASLVHLVLALVPTLAGFDIACRGTGDRCPCDVLVSEIDRAPAKHWISDTLWIDVPRRTVDRNSSRIFGGTFVFVFVWRVPSRSFLRNSIIDFISRNRIRIGY